MSCICFYSSFSILHIYSRYFFFFHIVFIFSPQLALAGLHFIVTSATTRQPTNRATRWSPTSSSTTCSRCALALTSNQEVLKSICGGFGGALRHATPRAPLYRYNHGPSSLSPPHSILSRSCICIYTRFLFSHFQEVPYDTPVIIPRLYIGGFTTQLRAAIAIYALWISVCFSLASSLSALHFFFHPSVLHIFNLFFFLLFFFPLSISILETMETIRD